VTKNNSDCLPPIMRGPRCGAKTRSGKPCQSPAANGYRRCRMHGGAPGSGAPKGNSNAVRKHTRNMLHASFVLADAIESKPSEEMQLWAAQYALENTSGHAFSKEVQPGPFSEEEQDKVVHLFQRVLKVQEKRRKARAGDDAKTRKSDRQRAQHQGKSKRRTR